MSKIKIVPIYFPQFHAIKENDEWWGKGFTDWTNVRNAKPLFEGHHQPRIPLNENYYDLTDIENIRWQVELAKKYSVYGFSIYHYWFDGKLVLNIPKELLLNNRELDIPFSLNWANERWTTRWEGENEKVILEQTHEPSIEKWEQHFSYLLDFFKDDRYIKIQNKPVFTIYRPHHIKKLDEMIACWNERAKECGFDGIYTIAVKSHELANESLLNSFDAVMRFQPFETVNSPAMLGKISSVHKLLRRLPEGVLNLIRKFNKKLKKSYTVYDYDAVCKHMVESDWRLGTKKVYDSIYLEWDNTARYKERATLFNGCTPERFEYWLDKLCAKASKQQDGIIFVNAWNEWAEGTYLEPDMKNTYQYLEALKRCVDKYNG